MEKEGGRGYIFEEKNVRSETINLLLFVKEKVRSKIGVFDHFFFFRKNMISIFWK